MKIYRREDINRIPISPAEAWDFFANPLNLDKLTPPEMAFANLYPLDAPAVYPGMLIVHRVSPLPLVKLTWVTEITHVDHGRRFVDEQRTGPFAMWHHIHEFEEIEGGTLVRDILYYALPFGILGRIAHAVQAGKKVNAVFDYRKQRLAELFGTLAG